MGYPTANVQEHYLNKQFEVLRELYENLPEILKVANHLTPVEDLIDFKDQVEALYAELSTLVAASELILSGTPAGIAMLQAADANAQRMLLGLGTAALRNEEYFATATSLTNAVDTLNAAILALQNQMGSISGDVGTALASLDSRLDVLEPQVSEHETRLDALDVTVANQGGSITNIQNQVNTINGTVTGINGDITAIGSQITQINVDLTNAEGTIAGHASSITTLESRVTLTENSISAQGSNITQLQADMDAVQLGVVGNADAISSLETRVSATEVQSSVHSTSITSLNAQMSTALNDINSQASALDTLTTRVDSTENGLTTQASQITSLHAAQTGIGNEVNNAGFERDTYGWEIFSVGAGWAGTVLGRNLANLVPAGMNALSIVKGGTITGALGVRNEKIGVIPGNKYFLSGYLAHENCTATLEYRIFNELDVEIGFGLIGTSNHSGSTNADDWNRSVASVVVPNDARTIQLQWWLKDVTGAVRAWLMRPMVEEAVEGQINASPWTSGAGGLDAKYADAVQTLNVEISDINGVITSQASAITALQASVALLPHVYLQPNEPTGGSYVVGDMWLDSDNGNEVHVWDGSVWGLSVDLIGATIYAQPSAPGNGSLRVGDTWFDTDDGNHPYRWNGTSWVDMTDARIPANAAAISALDTRVTSAEGTISAQSTAITDLQTDVAGKADSSVVAALDSRVTTAEGSITSQGSAITTLNSAIGTVVSQGMTALFQPGAISSWNLPTGSTVEVTYPASSGSMGGYVMRVGNNSGNDEQLGWHKTSVPFDATKLYRIRVRYRRVSGSGLVSLGLVCLDASKANFVRSNNDLIASTGVPSLSHYAVSDAAPALGVWQTGEFYVKGRTAGSASGSWTIASPYQLPAQAAHIAPLYIANYSGMAGEVEFDYIIIEDAADKTDSVANASAISALDTRVTAVEGVNISQASSIISLDTRMTAAEGVNTSQATAINSLDTRVTAAEGVNTSQASSITSLQSALSGYTGPGAVSSAISLLDSRVTSAEGTITAQGTALTSVSARIDNSSQINPNLLKNAAFRIDLNSWVVNAGTWYKGGVDGDASGTYAYNGGRGAGLDSILSQIIPLTGSGGYKVSFSADTICNGVGHTRLSLWCYDASDTYLGSIDSNLNSGSTEWVRVKREGFLLPAGTVKVTIKLISSSTTAFSGFRRVKLERGDYCTPFDESIDTTNGVKATQLLDARVTTTEAGVSTFLARYTVTLDVNGYVSGFRSENTGNSSDFTIVADKFKIVSPGGGARTEYSSSNWRVYDASGVLRVRMGIW